MGAQIFHKISSSMLMGFGSHFGSLLSSNWESDSSSFIHSRLKSRFLINLSFTSATVSKALKFISFFASRKLQFLYFFSEAFTRFLYEFEGSRRFWEYNFFLIGRWLPGVLTNYKFVRIKIAKFFDYTNLLSYPGGLVFLGDPGFLPIASAEARSSKVPSIGLTDVDNGFSPFSYSIPSNNKSFSVSAAYYRLFLRATESGRVLSNIYYRKGSELAIRKYMRQLLYFSRFKIMAQVPRAWVYKGWRHWRKFVRFPKQRKVGRKYRGRSRWRRHDLQKWAYERKSKKLFGYNSFGRPFTRRRFPVLRFDLFLVARLLRSKWLMQNLHSKKRALSGKISGRRGDSIGVSRKHRGSRKGFRKGHGFFPRTRGFGKKPRT